MVKNEKAASHVQRKHAVFDVAHWVILNENENECIKSTKEEFTTLAL